MKHLIALIAWLVLMLLTSGNVKGQKSCPFQIDNQRILTNQNLDTFLHLFKTDSFVVRNKKKYIPRFIKKELKCLSYSKFRIANPGKPYNESDFIWRNLPMRQVVFLAKSKNAFVMQYKRGGIGLSDNLVCILYNGKQIVDLWKGTVNMAVDFKPVTEISAYVDEMKKNNLPLFRPDIYF